ncbi:carotenoid biosynthesis protein [Granulicella mallensis]|nr:carotenoid biosynthesis protein [Granulicella mallensis]
MLKKMAWLFFAITSYLILADAVQPWMRLPKLGHAGFTMVFVLFSLLHCAVLKGKKTTAYFFAVSAFISFALEEIGVRTGLIYGHYHYSNLLGPKLGSVPIIIPLAWFMMIYPSWRLAGVLTRAINSNSLFGRSTQALIAAMVMTAWDMVMDPANTAAGLWIWERGGIYFGVPRQNYLGWIFTTFLIYWTMSLLSNGKQQTTVDRGFSVLPVMVYALYAVRYIVADRVPALQLVALFAMGMPAFLALASIYLNRQSNIAVIPE